MDTKIISLLAACLVGMTGTEASDKDKLVVYWGQNAVYNQRKERQYWEKDLTHFCENSKYDIIILAFLHVFFDRRQKDDMPGLNFAFHCETSASLEHPFLLRCPNIEAGIKVCQRNGKNVLISLGGAAGQYGFKNDTEAKLFAYRIWNLLLGGSDLRNLRPFGNATLDGVDLDIEGGSHIGYTAFVRELRALEKSDSLRKYIIAAAPQCPYPDAYLGPWPGKALGDVPELFDEIYIQFYNNYCGTGNAQQFYPNLRKWLDYSKNQNGPMIYVGVPSDERATYGSGYYRTPTEMATIYQKITNEPRFGGFMFWDASFDQNNVIGGRQYSDHVSALFENGGAPRPSVNSTTLPPQSQTPTTPEPPEQTPQTTEPPVAPTNPGSLSCNNLSDGIYPHPSDCTKFFMCSNGKLYVMSCPSGLKFNPNVKSCDWPRNVTC